MTSIAENRLLGWRRLLSGKDYFILGFSLLMAKFILDCWISWLFGHEWSPMIYLRPSNSFGLLAIPEGQRGYYWMMLVAAMPFIWIGVVATFRRLRTIGMPPALTILFFVPVVNLFVFLALVLAPEPTTARERSARPTTIAPPQVVLESESQTGMEGQGIAPLVYGQPRARTPRGSILIAAAAPVVPAIFFTLLSTHALGNYGWGLFVGAPFAVSFTAGILCGRFSNRKSYIFLAGMLSLLFWMGSMILLQIEGAVCLIMAAPIVLIMGGLGALVGMALHSAVGSAFDEKKSILMLLLVPSTMALEHWSREEAPVFAVTTCVDVAAPRDRVWTNVIRFPELTAPSEWIFHSGVSYPTSATIAGAGVGARRECKFTTGTFVEPITVWDEPRLLRFNVTENPAPLAELNPFGHVDPPHLHGFFVSQQGQFHLIELSDGRTRLEGTTWYQHHMWPAGYWSVWSDYVIHRIHGRVLEHIKTLAEGEQTLRWAQGSERP